LHVPTSSEWFIAVQAVVLVVGVLAAHIARPILPGASAARRVAVLAFAALGALLLFVTTVAVVAGVRAAGVDMDADTFEGRHYPVGRFASIFVGLDAGTTRDVAAYVAAFAVPLAGLCIVTAAIARHSAPRTALRWAAVGVGGFVALLGLLVAVNDTGGAAGGAGFVAADLALIGLGALGWEHLAAPAGPRGPSLRLDHLVYAVPDLDGAATALGARLGITPVAGGRHDGRGTHNALLAFFDGSYLELIAPDPAQPEPAAGRPFGVRPGMAPALVSWAVRTDDLDATVAAARAAGVDPGPVAAMSRSRPDGVRLAWRLTAPAAGDVLPFLIDWGSSPHPSDGLPAVELVAFDLAHPDPVTTHARLVALGTPRPVARAPYPTLRATVRGPAGSVQL
jgi:hypothetical protein